MASSPIAQQADFGAVESSLTDRHQYSSSNLKTQAMESLCPRGEKMFHAAKNIWLVPVAVALMAYANVVLKLRIAALGGNRLVSWLSYLLAMMLDPWTWSALIAAVATGLLYVVLLRNLTSAYRR